MIGILWVTLTTVKVKKKKNCKLFKHFALVSIQVDNQFAELVCAILLIRLCQSTKMLKGNISFSKIVMKFWRHKYSFPGETTAYFTKRFSLVFFTSVHELVHLITPKHAASIHCQFRLLSETARLVKNHCQKTQVCWPRLLVVLIWSQLSTAAKTKYWSVGARLS